MRRADIIPSVYSAVFDDRERTGYEDGVSHIGFYPILFVFRRICSESDFSQPGSYDMMVRRTAFAHHHPELEGVEG